MPELMDDFTTGGAELTEALRHLRRLNRLLAAAAPTLYGVHLLWERAGRPKRLTVLDIGAGSGDVNRSLLRWAEARGVELTITLADITEEACVEARLVYRDEPRVKVVQRDLFTLDAACADIVTGTQFVHHFSSDELPKVIRQMLAASRLGVVLGDIHRHWLAWAAVWAVTRIISRNRYIRHDGPLSVAKGFTAADWQSLQQTLGKSEFMYKWRPLFRYTVVIGAE